MSRPPTGPALVDRLGGSDHARTRVRVILDTIAGRLSVDEAAAQLSISPARFHVLRDEILGGAIAAAEPKPLGRPPAAPPTIDELAAASAAKAKELQDAKVELELARVREEVLLVFGPRLGRRKKNPGLGWRGRDRR